MNTIYKTVAFRITLRKNNNFVVRKKLNFDLSREYSGLSCMDYNNNYENKPYQPVADFYAGKSVFITGGTGFLGKVLIEKLLYSCTDLDKIYILVRDKKGVKVSDRMEEVFKNPLFTRIKKTNPRCLEKIVPVTGDITAPNLGIKSEDEQKLMENVSVIFHGAATIKFNEPLPVAMNINYEGTQKILKLSQRMKNIEAFVYISTAFAHIQNRMLQETIYPSPAKLEDVYKFIEEYGHDDRETMKLLNGRPNTYTYTKALTEAYVAENHGHVPSVIIRPSVVTPIMDAPIKGWVDNWFGVTPLVYNVAKGWNRIAVGDDDNFIDMIPVDYVTNLTIVAAARANRSKEIQVFNSSTSTENPITWADTYKYFTEETVARGKNEAPFPGLTHTKSKALVAIVTFLLQTTPAHIADMWMRITGREAKYAKVMSEAVTLRDFMILFTSKSHMMRAERARKLYSSLSPEDRQEFPCDPTQIKWPEYIKDYARGVYRFLKPRYTTKS